MYITKEEEIFIGRIFEKVFENLSVSDKYMVNRILLKMQESRRRGKQTMTRYLERRRKKEKASKEG